MAMKRLISGALTTVFFFFGAAIIPTNAGQAVSEKKLKIVVGYQPLTPTWGATIVTGAKLWKPYLTNVEVERFDAMSGMPLVNNMLADKINIAYLGDMPAIILASKSEMAQTRFVSLTDTDEGGASIIYVRKGSPFKTIKDLDGKVVSITFGSFTHRFAKVVEAREKVTFKFVGQAPEVGLTSLQSGKVDAWSPWPPYGDMVAARGLGEPLVNGTQYNFDSLRGIVVTKAFADAYPDVVVGWLRAELDAHKIMRERPDQAAKIIYDDWKQYEVPLEVIKQEFAYKTFPDEITPKWRLVLSEGAKFLIAHKFIESEPDLNTFIDDSWLKKAASIPSQME
jgi:NitT/TauT family transport system substrate-binding protein